MTFTLEIPEDLKDELVNEAAQLGLSLPEYTLHLLYTRSVLKVPPQNGSDLVAYWKSAGVIGTRPDIVDGQAHARKLRVKAQSRDWDNAN